MVPSVAAWVCFRVFSHRYLKCLFIFMWHWRLNRGLVCARPPGSTREMWGHVLGIKTHLEKWLWLELLLMIMVIQGMSHSEPKYMRWIEIHKDLGITTCLCWVPDFDCNPSVCYSCTGILCFTGLPDRWSFGGCTWISSQQASCHGSGNLWRSLQLLSMSLPNLSSQNGEITRLFSDS